MTIRTSALSAIAFFWTLGALSVGYSAYTGLSSVSSWQALTVWMWTQVKDNFADLDGRLANFNFSGGGVGIGGGPSGSKFTVNVGTDKNVRFNTDTSVGTNEARISSTNDAYTASSPLWINGSYVGIQTNGSERIRVIANGNVGIGTSAPSANLEVAGSIKFGGRQISKITVCSFWGTPNSTLANRFYHYWTGSECDNGLPSWSCLGFITKAWHNGSDQDWEVVFPGEDPGSAGWAATNGGMAWWTASSWAGLGIRATYMCQ